MRLAVSKRHSLGNEYIVVDVRRTDVPPASLHRLGQMLCDRGGPLGADGAAFLSEAIDDDVPLVRVFNPSGSESELCLNGLRCVARSLLDEAHREHRLRAATGIVTVRFEPPFAHSVVSIAIEVPVPIYGLRPPHAVDAVEGHAAIAVDGVHFVPITNGVPHLLAVVPAIELGRLVTIGEALQQDPRFPTGMNVSFASVLDEQTFFIKTFERGGAGLTTACSSALSAAARVMHDLGLVRGDRVTGITSGGPSEIAFGAESLWLRANVTTLFNAAVDVADNGAALDVVAREETVEASAFAAWIRSTSVGRIESTIVAGARPSNVDTGSK